MTSRPASPPPGRPVEVVHLIGCLDLGGAETVALDLCRTIPSTEVRQTFVCLAGRRGQLADDFERAGARVVPLPVTHPLFLARLALLLRRQPTTDVVMSHVSLASGLLLALARVLGVPTRIARFHSQDDGRGTNGLRSLYRVTMRILVALNSTHVLGVTGSSVHFGLGGLRRFAERRGTRVAVVPNGVDTDVFTPAAEVVSSRPLVALHVGRASTEKNRQMLAPILHSLRRTGSAELRVVGSLEQSDLGPDADALTIIGPTRDVASELRRGQVLVLPSTWEGLPTVVLEALACDIAVVASDLPGIAEIARLTQGVTLVTLESSPDEWASAVRSAATRTGQGSIRRAFLSSPFTLDRSVRAWLQVWRAAQPRPDGAAPGFRETT